MTLAQEQSFIRLFMVPGMGHCAGGPGPNSFDALSPLIQWVEQGVAPSRIVATKYINDNPTQGIQMTRPLCAYPQEARFRSGDPNAAQSFICTSELHDEPPSELPARDYLAPLIINARIEPASLNLHSRGDLTVFLTTPPGSDDLTQWVVTDLRLEGFQFSHGGYTGDGHTFIAHFDRQNLANFTGGVPLGEPVDVMITGTLHHNGSPSLFATSATVRILGR